MKNQLRRYRIGGTQLKSSNPEKDPGILVSSHLNMSQWCGAAAKKT